MKIFLLALTLGLVCISSLTHGCDFGDVKFDNSFSGARLDKCKRTYEDRFLLTIKPENTPINNSPWYAFKVSAKQQQVIKVTLKYIDGTHRYAPKVSSDGFNWKSIRYKKSRKNNQKISFFIEVGQKPIWVAGQEIINNERYLTWAEKLIEKSPWELSVIGQSTERRNIYQLQTKSSSDEWLVIVGRMHPPEITGALALFPFVNELSINQQIGTEFRQRFNILVIPNLNPDGVANGNWRHNSKGVDLNRDWGKFTQKETQIVAERLKQIDSSGGKIVFAVDFHSTRKNIFYTMPGNYGVQPANFVDNWLSRLDREMPDFKVVKQAGSNPDKGVFKQYIADTYGVHAVTYEMADNESRNKIIKIAKNAAETLMQELLATPRQELATPGN